MKVREHETASPVSPSITVRGHGWDAAVDSYSLDDREMIR